MCCILQLQDGNLLCKKKKDSFRNAAFTAKRENLCMFTYREHVLLINKLLPQ